MVQKRQWAAQNKIVRPKNGKKWTVCESERPFELKTGRFKEDILKDHPLWAVQF